MSRNDWEFEYLGKELRVFAVNKMEHHRNRLAFWEEQAANREKELREQGIDFRARPRVANNYSTQNAVVAVIDPERQSALSEAFAKVDEHRGRLRHFEMWASLFNRNPEATFKATWGDIDFFNAVEDEE